MKIFAVLWSIAIALGFSLSFAGAAAGQNFTLDLSGASVQLLDSDSIRFGGVSVRRDGADLGIYAADFQWDSRSMGFMPVAATAGRWSPGDTVPGVALRAPYGSRADVKAIGTFADGAWTVMMTRSLTTATPGQDVQFDRLASGQLYSFSVATLDNNKGNPETMAPQDNRAYTLGIVGSGADLPAVRETPSNPGQFTGQPFTTNPSAGVAPATLKAAFDDNNIYILATWTDASRNESIQKSWWTFDGTRWQRSGDEDRIAIMWNINASDFGRNGQGCSLLCHVGETPGEGGRMRTNNPGEATDMWHWKAARSNPVGFVDDQYTIYDTPQGGRSTRPGDSGTAADIDNRNQDGTAPLFQAVGDPGARAKFLIQMPQGTQRSVSFVP